MKAFPSNHDRKTGTMQLGMELRDYFAAKAMQSLMWDKDLNLDSKEDVAEVAYAYADAMMKARDE